MQSEFTFLGDHKIRFGWEYEETSIRNLRVLYSEELSENGL